MKVQLELDPELVEQSVFLEIRRREREGDASAARLYRTRIDPLYLIRDDPERRESAFQREHSEFFESLGLAQKIRSAAAEFTLFEERLDRIVFLRAVKRRQEGAELFVLEDHGGGGAVIRTAVLRICPERFQDPSRLHGFLWRELRHIADMVDPCFAYGPDLQTEDLHPAAENLIRDRYRVLWELYTEARFLAAEGDGQVMANGNLTVVRRAPSHGSLGFVKPRLHAEPE